MSTGKNATKRFFKKNSHFVFNRLFFENAVFGGFLRFSKTQYVIIVKIVEEPTSMFVECHCKYLSRVAVAFTMKGQDYEKQTRLGCGQQCLA